MPAQNMCNTCAVPIAKHPEEDGFHPVQTETETPDGLFCEACADDDGLTGDQVVRASEVDVDDDELAKMLAEAVKAEELRRWMNSNGLTRSRGARKLESARQAVEQDRLLVAATVDDLHGLSETEPHVAICSCGFEEYFSEEGDAVEAAKNHKSENPQHFPKAWKNGSETCLYGR